MATVWQVPWAIPSPLQSRMGLIFSNRAPGCTPQKCFVFRSLATLLVELPAISIDQFDVGHQPKINQYLAGGDGLALMVMAAGAHRKRGVVFGHKPDDVGSLFCGFYLDDQRRHKIKPAVKYLTLFVVLLGVLITVGL